MSVDSSATAPGPSAFFVYGTLRPDDHNVQPYRAAFLEGLTCHKATVSGAQLYVDQYPAVVLDAKGAEEGKENRKVVGYVCFFEGESAAELFQRRLVMGDRIEGYPDYYDRAVVKATTLVGEGQNKQQIQCYIYHRTSLDKSNPIPSGDWLDRGKTRPGRIPTDHDDDDQSNKVLVFGYGSNGVKQLQGRLKNPNVQCQRALLPDYCRAFCLQSPRWGGRSEGVSGVATLVAKEGEKTYGSVSTLTPEELITLDGFEGGYNRVKITVNLYDDGGAAVPVTAFAYLANCGNWVVPPSEQYLTAIHVHLREYWSMEGESITMRGFDQAGDLVTAKEWFHPGPARLSLEALCVEVNARRTGIPWEMPRTIGELVAKLNAVGVETTLALQAKLNQQGGGAALNAALTAAGQKPFMKETIEILERLLSVQS